MRINSRWSRRQTAWLAAATIICALAPALLMPATASAGEWMQVICTNPNGSPAGFDGMTPQGNAVSGACGTAGQYFVLKATEAQVGSWIYAAPAGSTIAGGSATVMLNTYQGGSLTQTPSQGAAYVTVPYATSQTGGYEAWCYGVGTAEYASLQDPCELGATGVVPIDDVPSAATHIAFTADCSGGCASLPTTTQVSAFDALLEENSSPTGSNFSGSLLDPDAYGTADLLFTAAEADGPGVYEVTVLVDGQTVYHGTPGTNSGECSPIGTDPNSGALMFDYAQPCPASETVDIPVDTTKLADGEHQLTVTVTDAAQNTSTVFDQTITTRQAGTGSVSTPPPPVRPNRVKTKLLIKWRYSGVTTRLLSVKARGLPRDASISVGCSGRGCPRQRVRTASAAHIERLWKALATKVFKAGDRETFTIAAPGLTSEQIELVIRKDKRPLAKVL
jgi:hypothetical protein